MEDNWVPSNNDAFNGIVAPAHFLVLSMDIFALVDIRH